MVLVPLCATLPHHLGTHQVGSPYGPLSPTGDTPRSSAAEHGVLHEAVIYYLLETGVAETEGA